MPTASTLSIDSLLAPIPGENPAGRLMPIELRDKLDEWRKEVDPNEYAEDDPTRPEQAKHADWDRIAAETERALRESSKDLRLAARLAEALVKRHGFAGLRDGLHLLRRMVADCWERIQPTIEDGDLERRAAPFFDLDDADRGWRFPSSVRSVPIVSVNGTKCSWLDFKRAQEGRSPISIADFEKAVSRLPIEELQRLGEDAAAAREELRLLTQALNDRLDRDAPSMTNLRQALDDCHGLLQMFLRRRGGEPAAENATAASLDKVDSSAGLANVPGSRQAAYELLKRAADILERIEPHSPVPYLVRRAVEMENLRFPQMIRTLVREANVLAELNRELGISEETPPAT